MASLIINTRLRGKEKPNTVSLYLFLGVIACDLPFFFTLITFGRNESTWEQSRLDLLSTWMFLGVGVIFYGFQFLRSWALLISNNASVVNLLYAEIAFSFLWGTTILHQPFYWTSLFGALLIILGCLITSHLKSRSARQSQPSATVQAPHAGDDDFISVQEVPAGCDISASDIIKDLDAGPTEASSGCGSFNIQEDDASSQLSSSTQCVGSDTV